MKSPVRRREFLKAGLICTGAMVASAPYLLYAKNEVLTQQFPDVAIAHGNDPATITRKAVEALGGIKRFVKPGNKVVIKPNMSFAAGLEEGSNTHPAVVAEVARMCSEAGATRIAVLDHTLQTPADCLSMSKVPEYCEKVPNASVSTVHARRLFREVAIPKGKEVKTMEVIGEVLDADVLIAVPVGKSHSSAGVSLSMKGMMGLIFDRRCFHSRFDLHQAIVDMVTVLTPKLVVIDATRILSTGGPRGPGKVIPLNMVIASTDMVAADAQMVAAGEWYGRKFKPDKVRHIRLAAEQGLGRADMENLTVKTIKT